MTATRKCFKTERVDGLGQIAAEETPVLAVDRGGDVALVILVDTSVGEFLRSIRKNCTSVNKCIVSRGVACNADDWARADFEGDYRSVLEHEVVDNDFELEK